MPKCQVKLLPSAWEDLDRIADYHLMMVGPASAEKITDAILDTVETLGDFPYMGPLHPDPVLAGREFRKVLCGNYVCVYRVIEPDLYVYRIVHGAADYPKYFKQEQSE